MKQFTLYYATLLLICFYFLPTVLNAQIGEFEGDVRISNGTATLEFYDTGDDRLKGLIRENSSNIYLEALRGDLRFATGNSGTPTTRMYIEGSTGHIGIGIANPAAKLGIGHNSNLSSAHMQLIETTPNDYSRIKFTNSGSVGNDFWDIAGRANGNNAFVDGAQNSRLNFYYKFKDGGEGHDYLSISPFNFFGEHLALFKFRGNLNPVKDNLYTIGTGSLRWSTVYAQNGTIQTSDIRMKKNIETIPYGLSELMELNPVTYQWKNIKNKKQQIGLIAQDVLQVIPEAVYATETVIDPDTGASFEKEVETMGMNYSTLIPVLIKSIQEQQEIINRLITKNDDLNKRLSNLEK